MEQSFFHLDFGNLLTIASMLGGIAGGVYATYARLDKLDDKVEGSKERITGVEDELKKQTQILIDLATQRERMNALDQRNLALEKRLDDLNTRINKVTP